MGFRIPWYIELIFGVGLLVVVLGALYFMWKVLSFVLAIVLGALFFWA